MTLSPSPNAMRAYAALMDHEMYDQRQSERDRAGMADEIRRLTKGTRSRRELELLARYKKAMEA